MSSVISASYYLKIIKIIMFDEPNNDTRTPQSYTDTPSVGLDQTHARNIPASSMHARPSGFGFCSEGDRYISPLHAISIATCTAFLTLFILDSELLINSIELAQFTI